MFELYGTGMKTQQLEEEEEELFICHIHSYTEYNQQWMCALHLTHPSAHTHTHTHTTLRCPGSSWGFGALLKGFTSVVDNSCRSREPTTSDYKSSALSIRPLSLSIITYSYTVLFHIQCGSVKSNAILIKIHKHITCLTKIHKHINKHPAPPDCLTAFSPRLWEPWTHITPPLSETPNNPPPPPYHITGKKLFKLFISVQFKCATHRWADLHKPPVATHSPLHALDTFTHHCVSIIPQRTDCNIRL